MRIVLVEEVTLTVDVLRGHNFRLFTDSIFILFTSSNSSDSTESSKHPGRGTMAMDEMDQSKKLFFKGRGRGRGKNEVPGVGRGKKKVLLKLG